MPRFVILQHSTPAHYPRPSHFDLLLEEAESCRTWALSHAPTAGKPIAAEQLAPHRLIYLDFEGPLEGDRGEVMRWESGQFEWLLNSALAVELKILGTRLRGSLVLTRGTTASDQWQCLFQPLP